ncbi:MAG: fibronectin type III domain-containing protein [Elusimicrobia bacterium]|nr:fibronectin type III domain-containing protein [Elusimicrobiota bacterium]
MKVNGLMWGLVLGFFPLIASAGWEIEQPEGTGVYGYWTSLALDTTGYPRFVYRDGALGGDLRFVQRDQVGWSTSTVESGLEINGGHGSLALTSAGTPLISYNKTGVGLRVAQPAAGGGWSINTVDSAGGLYTSLKVSSTGTVFVSYFSSNTLKVATFNGTVWSTATVDNGGQWSSLALTSTGVPVVSYYDPVNADLKYAQWTGAVWSTQTVVSTGTAGKYSSLVLDSSDKPMISYQGDGALQFAQWNGYTWTFQTVDPGACAYTSLALDPSGKPVIAYEHANSALKLATSSGTTWSTQTIDTTNGRYASLAIGPDGSPHITYGSSFLFYAKNEILAVPVGISHSSRTTSGITWKWTDTSSGEQGFRVFRASDSSNLSGDLPANTTSWAQTGLTPNTSAQVIVRAFNQMGYRDSIPSPILYTLSNTPAASQISSFGGTTATMTWSSNGNPDGTTYEVEKSTDALSFFNVLDSTSPLARVADLKDGTTNYLRVRSKTVDGIASHYDSVVALFLPPLSPPAPAGDILVKNRSTSTLTWGWTDNSVWEKSFQVIRATDGVAISSGLAANTVEWIQTGLAPNTSSQILVRSSNTFGSSDSELSPLRHTLAAVPGTPVVDSFFGTGATVSWSANGNAGGTRFRLETSADAITFIVAASTVNLSAPVSGLVGGTTNFFRVRAENGDGIFTAYSSTSSIYLPPVIAPVPPGAPEVVSRSTSSLVWTWIDNSSIETGFVVLKSSGLAPLSPVLPPDTTSWVQQGLSPNTSSQIAVKAENQWGTNFSLDSPVRYTLADLPVGLSAIPMASLAADVSWLPQGNPGGTRYRIENSLDGSDFSLVTLTTATTVLAEGLVDGATTYFRVRAENGDGLPTLFSSTAAVFLPVAVAPGVPENLTLVNRTTSTLTWAWTEGPGETEYRVFLASGLIPLSSVLPADTVQWTQTGLSPNQSVQIVVRASNTFGFSDSVPSAAMHTLAAVPVNPITTLIGTDAAIEWESNGNTPLTSYWVEKSIDGIEFETVESTTSLVARALNLRDGTTHYFRIRAVNGNGELSEAVNFFQYVPAVSLPDVPGNPFVTQRTQNEIVWGWVDRSHNESGFRVIDNDIHQVLATLPANTTTWAQTGLGPNSSAAVQIESFNALGFSRTNRLYPAQGEPTLADSPAQPSVADVAPTQVTVNWTGANNPGGTLYQIYVATDNLSFVPTGSPQTAHSFQLDGLLSGQTYSFRVDAVNAGGLSTPGPIVTAIVPFGPPPAPSFFRAEALSTSKLRWVWAPVSNADGYRVLRASDNFILSGDLGPSVWEWVQEGVTPNETQFVKIQPHNVYGSSVLLSSGTVLAAPPLGLWASVIKSTEITFQWESNGNHPATPYLPEISTDNVTFATVASNPPIFLAQAVGLSESTTYYFRVTAISRDSSNPNATSDVLTVQTPPALLPPPEPVGTPPNAPSALLPVVSAQSVLWRWQPVFDTLGYRVMEGTQTLSELPPESTVWEQANLSPNRLVSVVVSAYNHFGSAERDMAAVTLANPPSQTTVSSVSAHQIVLDWNANGNPDATPYDVELSTDSLTFYTVAETTRTRVEIPVNSAEILHRLRVRARNGAGILSDYNVIVSTKFVPATEPSASMPFPQRVGTDHIVWAWTNPLVGVSGFRVFSPDGKDLSGLLPSETLSWTQEGLGPNAPSRIILRAEGLFGVLESTASALAYTRPRPLQNLQLLGYSHGKASLAWDLNNNPADTGYKIFASSGAGDPFVAAEGTGSNAVVGFLQPRTHYALWVQGVGPGGESDRLGPITLTTTADPMFFDLANPDWKIETVDDRPGAGAFARLGLENGVPRIVYSWGDELNQALHGKSGWSVTPLFNAPANRLVTDWDGDGRVQTAYFDRNTKTTKYVGQDEGHWVTSVVPADSAEAGGTSYPVGGQGFQGIDLRTQKNGEPVIVYTAHIGPDEMQRRVDHGIYRIYEARRQGSNWTQYLAAEFQTFGGTGEGSVKLALDSQANPHITYF